MTFLDLTIITVNLSLSPSLRGIGRIPEVRIRAARIESAAFGFPRPEGISQPEKITYSLPEDLEVPTYVK